MENVSILSRFKAARFNLYNRLLHLWIRPTVLGCDPDKIGPKPGQKLCYVMPWRSLADLLVIDQACQMSDLPRAFNGIPDTEEDRAFFFLGHPEGFFGRKSFRNQSARMLRLLDLQADQSDEIMIVPVSLFWGHQPDRENSIFRLLLSENWTATNRFKKFLSLIFHRNHILVQFAAPLSLREIVTSEDNSQRQIRKLGRILRTHFNQQRQAIIGPDLSHRRTLITNMLTSTNVLAAIEDEAKTADITYERAQKLARDYAHEVASHQSYRVIRFFHLLLTWLWHRLYDGIQLNNIDVVKDLAQRHELVYVPCHRSHIDYLLLSYVLYHNGLTPPHIAAGINLNMPVVGSLLRRAGAFFMRRSFRGNDLYKTVFDEYLHLMFTSGYSVEYFIEGGRSRTGRTLNPRTGMLNMTIKSYLRNPSMPIVFMPVYFGYERILEVSTYLDELQGKPKKQESLMDILRVLRSLKNEFGRVTVNFGEPLHLSEHLDKTLPDWHESVFDEDTYSSSCHLLATDIARRINAATAINPVNLTALALLSTPKQAMEEKRLLQQLDILKQLATLNPYSKQTTNVELDAAEMIEYAARVAHVRRVDHSFGSIIRLEPRDTVILTYYANNIIHIYSLYSLICRWYRHRPGSSRNELSNFLNSIYPFLQAENFLSWSPEQLDDILDQHIGALVSVHLLLQDGDDWKTPQPDSSHYACLTDIAEFIEPTLERYFIVASLLESHPEISPDTLKSSAALVAERLNSIYGTDSPDFFDASLFSTFVKTLEETGFLSQQENQLVLNQEFETLMQASKMLLDSDVQYNVLQSTQEVRLDSDLF